MNRGREPARIALGLLKLTVPPGLCLHWVTFLANCTATHFLSDDELVNYCEIIASASGGMLGIHRISSEERALLASIASKLKGPK